MIRRLCLPLALASALGCHEAPAPHPPSPAPAPRAQAPGAPPSIAPKPVPAELPPIVARVNGEPIERGELDQAVKAATARNGGVVPPDQRNAIYRGVLDQLVATNLLLQESKARKLAITDAELGAQVDAIRKQFPSEEVFKQTLAGQGITPETLPQQVRKGMLASKLVNAEIAPRVAVEPQDVKAFYEQNPQHFKEQESARASHILVRVAEGADDAARKKARAEVDAILGQLKAGADFATLAKARSQDPGSGPRGGDLGPFHKGQMVPAFENAAFALKPGEMSGVVESPFGFHIIKMAERRPARTVPLPEVSDKIREFLAQRQRQQKTDAFVEQLKAKAKVEILI